MKLTLMFAVSALSLGLTVVQANAESEGNGDPFPFRAPAQASGTPFVADTGSAAYPELTGQASQQPSPTRMVAAFGAEAPVQAATSLPRRFDEGTVTYAQAQSLDRYATAGALRVRIASSAVTVR